MYFVGYLIPLFWTSVDICSGFQSLDGFPHLHASLPTCNRFFRFTSSAIPADFLVASMVAEPFRPRTFAQALVGLELEVSCLIKLSRTINNFVSR